MNTSLKLPSIEPTQTFTFKKENINLIPKDYYNTETMTSKMCNVTFLYIQFLLKNYYLVK